MQQRDRGFSMRRAYGGSQIRDFINKKSQEAFT